MKNEYKTLEQQIVELWKSCGMKVIQERFHFDTWIIKADVIDKKTEKIDYNIIEKKIKELWKSRGMNAHTITLKRNQWTIIADRELEEKK